MLQFLFLNADIGHFHSIEMFIRYNYSFKRPLDII